MHLVGALDSDMRATPEDVIRDVLAVAPDPTSERLIVKRMPVIIRLPAPVHQWHCLVHVDQVNRPIGRHVYITAAGFWSDGLDSSWLSLCIHSIAYVGVWLVPSPEDHRVS